jgi:hypothetical protein
MVSSDVVGTFVLLIFLIVLAVVVYRIRRAESKREPLTTASPSRSDDPQLRRGPEWERDSTSR